MFAYCENNPIFASDPTGLYRLIEGWTPPGKTQSNEKPKETMPPYVERTITLIKGLFYATSIDAGLGIGFGGNVEVLGANADLRIAHNYLEFCLDDGKFDVRSSDKIYTMIEIPIFSVGYEKVNYGNPLEMDICENDAGGWGAKSAFSVGIGVSLYMGWLGCSANVAFDLVKFLEYVGENW